MLHSIYIYIELICKYNGNSIAFIESITFLITLVWFEDERIIIAYISYLVNANSCEIMHEGFKKPTKVVSKKF